MKASVRGGHRRWKRLPPASARNSSLSTGLKTMNDNWPIHDSVEAFVAKLEAFSEEFLRIASTPEQAHLAKQFEDFVAVVEPATIARALEPAHERAYHVHTMPEIDLER